MRKLLLLAFLLLLAPARGHAQYVVVGQGCGASGLNAIANDGTPVVCRGNPLVWTAVGGSGGGLASPTPSTIFAWDPKYSLKNDAKFICDAGISNGSNIVSSTANDRPFSAADVGKIMWAASATCSGLGTPKIPTILIAQGTITGFTDATHVTVSNNASATCTLIISGTDGCVFVWGSDDTSAIQSAWNDAANACGVLVLPGGGILLQAPPVNTTSKCPVQTGANDVATIVTVQGQGPYSTMLLMSPSTTFGNSMFSMNNSNFNRQRFHDFGIASFSPGPAASNGQIGFNIGFYGAIYNVHMLNYFPCDNVACSNAFTAISAGGVGNAPAYVYDNNLMYAGNTSIAVSNDVYIHDNVSDFNNRCLSVGSGPVYSSNNTFVLCGVQGGIRFDVNNGTLFSSNDQISCRGSSLPCVGLGQSGGTGTLVADNIAITQTATTTGVALSLAANTTAKIGGVSSIIATSASNGGTGSGISNAGTLTLQNTAVSGAGTTVALNNSSSAIIKEGNSFSTGITNTGSISGQQGQGVLEGACTGVVTSASTVGLYGLGQFTATTCTSTTVNLGQVMSKTGTIYALYCTATAGNQAADACTVVKNGAAQTMTCSLNAVTACTDGTTAHAVTYVAGDVIGIEVIAGTATTLANVKGLAVIQ